MKSDPVLAERLEDNLNRRNELANPETIVTVLNVSKTDATKRARHSELEAPQESANTGGASSSSAQADVDMRVIHAGKRPLEPDDDADMVCGLDVCDELDETHFTDTYINDYDGDYIDEATGATLRRVDVAKARMEAMKWYEKFNAFEEVTDETCASRTGHKPSSCRWKDINKGDSERVEVRSRLVAREIKQKGTDSYFAGTPPLTLVRYVISRAATLSKTGKRRQLMVLDAKRAFLHADALTETYVKTPHLRDTERCRLLNKCMYGTLPAAAGWQHLVRRVGTDICLLSSSNCPCAFGHSSRDLDMVVHGEDFIIAGDGDDFDWLSQKLNEKLELVQNARLGPGYDNEATVLNSCVMYSDSGLTTRDMQSWQWQNLVFRRRVHRRARVVPSRMRHCTMKSWNLMDRKPTTACQQDCHIWHQTDLTSHSLARSAVVQSERQHVQTSRV